MLIYPFLSYLGEIQDLKSGVSRIALGVCAQHPDLDLKIVPCGLNYVKGHRFRSKVLIHFGPPMDIDGNLVEQFQSESPEVSRNAVKEHLTGIEDAMRGIHSLSLTFTHSYSHTLIH
jgi:glycerol-3-phosphate O-acyltransferase / dihydroxyacetone phosphate acyltransferase